MRSTTLHPIQIYNELEIITSCNAISYKKYRKDQRKSVNPGGDEGFTLWV